jgi:hypothetical protein
MCCPYGHVFYCHVVYLFALSLLFAGINKKIMSMHVSVGGNFFNTALMAANGDSCERVKQVPIIICLLDLECFSHFSSLFSTCWLVGYAYISKTV